MATREKATLDANTKRMNRNSAEMKRPLSQQRPLETLKELPRGKTARKDWKPSRKSSGRS